MEGNGFFLDKPKESVIKVIVGKYLPYWPLLLIIGAIAFFFTYVYLRSKPKIYVAAAKALIKDPNKTPAENQALEALNIFNEKKVVENEIVVLKSTSLLNEVVKGLDIYATIYNKGKVQTEELYGIKAPVKFIAADKENVTYVGTHQLDIDWTNNAIVLDERKIPFNTLFKLGNDEFKAVPNEAYTKFLKGKNYYVTFNTVAQVAYDISGALSISANSYQSSVVNLDLKTQMPAKGVDILNRLFEEYNRAAIKDKNINAGNTLKFIEDRLYTVSRQLDSIEKNIKNVKAERNIVDLGSQASSYLNAVGESERKATELQMQSEIIGNLQSYINAKGDKPGTVPDLKLVNDPVLASLTTQLYNAEFELDKNRSIAGEMSESVKLSKEKVERIKKDIRESLSNIRRNIGAQQSTIYASIAKNKGLLGQVPAKELALLETKRQEMVKNAIYNYLLQKREETALSSASTSGDLRVLEAGYSYGPISPKPFNYYIFALLASIGLFALILQIREHLNNRVMFRSQIEDKTTIPVVGEISQTKDKRTIIITPGERTIVAEQFRSLRTNLGFMGMNDKDNAILVSSCVSGEGKSFVAANLAASFSLTGKKVALIEMDLRKPRLSLHLGVNHVPGITNYLLGEVALDEIIKPTQHENLYLISSGQIPPNPSELVMTEKFGAMMDELKARFDYLILDTAPIGLVTDALLINKYIGTTLFVIRHNITPLAYLKLVEELHSTGRAKNMCVVFNGIKPRGFSLFNYRFSNGYGSSYGSEYGYAHHSKYGDKKGYYSK